MWWNCHHCWGRVQVFHSRHLSCCQGSLCQVSNSSCGPPWVVSFLFLSCLSFGQLWTLNGKPYASVWLALITLGLDRATFVRSMSVCSTTSVAAESFCLWSPRSVHVVDLDRVFSGALRQQSRFLHGRFCIPHNSHGFCQVKVFLLEQFLL